MSDSNYVIGDTPEDLNRVHNVTLTEGQISTILYTLEDYLERNGGNSIVEIDNIFEELEGVLDKFYNQDPQQVTLNQLQSIKGNLL